MSWMGPGRKYYYLRRRTAGGRRDYSYIGNGPAAEMGAELDRLDREQRAIERQAAEAEQAPLAELDQGLDQLAAQLRDLVAAELEAAGYHQHKRQWRKRRDSNRAESAGALLGGPQARRRA